MKNSRRVLTEEEILDCMADGWSREDVTRGFAIFSSFSVMNGAEHIQKIDIVDMYDGDSVAAEYAEKEYGIKIIHDIPFDEISDMDKANFIDTEDNRKIISEYLKKEYGIDWR